MAEIERIGPGGVVVEKEPLVQPLLLTMEPPSKEEVEELRKMAIQQRFDFQNLEDFCIVNRDKLEDLRKDLTYIENRLTYLETKTLICDERIERLSKGQNELLIGVRWLAVLTLAALGVNLLTLLLL